MTRMMAQGEPEWQTMSIRLPRGIKTWLEAEAARNDRSKSSEVVQILRARMHVEQSSKAAQPKKAAG